MSIAFTTRSVKASSSAAHLSMCIGVRRRQVEREGERMENQRAFESLEADIVDSTVICAQRVDNVHKRPVFGIKNVFCEHCVGCLHQL